MYVGVGLNRLDDFVGYAFVDMAMLTILNHSQEMYETGQPANSTESIQSRFVDMIVNININVYSKTRQFSSILIEI